MRQNIKKMKHSLKILTRQNLELKSEINQVGLDVSMKIQSVIDAVANTESAVQHLQEEMTLMVQTLQAILCFIFICVAHNYYRQ